MVVVLRNNRYAPASVVLMLVGIGIVGVQGKLGEAAQFGFNVPPLTTFSVGEVWRGLVLAGFAQIALTAGNAVIATSALIKEYFPDKPVSEQRLGLNHGIMNVVTPFFGGMAMCHGVGGLAGQYYFGARTGRTNIIEGFIEIGMGLFLATSIATLFVLFPQAVLGAMMLLVGIELTKFARDVRLPEAPIMALTAGLSLATNMAIGFVAGVLVYQAARRWGKGNRCLSWIAGE
jgi:MFS superfamily sulfate permease-like transporter